MQASNTSETPRVVQYAQDVTRTSDETGLEQVHLRSFPDGRRVMMASIERGFEPRWRANGEELFFAMGRMGEVQLMAVRIKADAQGGLQVGVSSFHPPTREALASAGPSFNVQWSAPPDLRPRWGSDPFRVLAVSGEFFNAAPSGEITES